MTISIKGTILIHNLRGNYAMEKLHVNDKLEKRAETALIPDSTQWVKLILTELVTRFPILQSYPLTVRWIKKHPNKGYALGAIQALGGQVPVIIRDYMLSPLDVIMFGSSTVPLNDEVIQKLVSSKSPFKGLEQVKPKTSLEMFGDRQYTPNDNWSNMVQPGSVVRDAVKVGSFIDRISTIDKDSVVNLLTAVKESNTLSDFESNETASILEKIAHKNTVSSEASFQDALRSLSIDRQYMFTDELGNTFVKQANASIDYTWTTEVSPNEVPELTNLVAPSNVNSITALEKTAHAVSSQIKAGATGFFKTASGSLPEFTVLSIEPIEELAKYAFYSLPNGQTLIVDNNRDYCVIAETHTKVASQLELSPNEPGIGDYGFWEQNGKAISEPFRVDGLFKVANIGTTEIKADHLFVPVTYQKVHTKFAGLRPGDIKNEYYVPGDANFIKLENEISRNDNVLRSFNKLAEVASSVDSDVKVVIKGIQTLQPVEYHISMLDDFETTKIAENKYKVSVVNADFLAIEETVKSAQIVLESNVVVKDATGLFNLIGGDFSKYAANGHSIHNLKVNDVVWTLVHCGASEEDIEKVAALRNGESYIIANDLQVPVKLEEVEQKYFNKHAELFDSTDLQPILLVKEASVISDSTTVDAVLSLGLIKKFNIMEYVQLLPDYERVCGELAKLLLMVRMGAINMAQEPIRVAMQAMMQVILMLHKVRTLANQGGDYE